MDLQKSIQKAKRIREASAQSISTRTSMQQMKEEGSGWVSPVYCDCRNVELNRKKAGLNRCLCVSLDAPELGYYKVLRTQIQHRCIENGWNTLMITSIQPGEGKTLTSINLALAFAQEFTRTVLLVDCDLKRQSIHKQLGFQGDKGLVDYLVDDVPLEDLIVWPGIEKLTLISGGRSVPNTAELLSSPKMKTAVAEMKRRYQDRYVIFDLPPLLSAADALAFSPLVDGILIVVQAERTRLPDIQEALDMVPEDKFLGFVLNRQRAKMDGYYYYKY